MNESFLAELETAIMFSLRNLTLLHVIAATLVLPAAAMAVLPVDQTIEFKIHKIPTDPTSPVTWTITTTIQALAQVGDDYQWEVLDVEIRKLGITPAYDEVWYEALPVVGTSDGYWWVAYLNNLSDFRQLPPIAGLAINDDPYGVDLNYDFGGGTPGTGTDEGTLTYTLQKEGDPEPEEDDDEVDIPLGVRDPLQTAQ